MRAAIGRDGLDLSPHKVRPGAEVVEAWGYEEPGGLDIRIRPRHAATALAVTVPIAWIRAYMRRLERAREGR